MIWDVKMPLRYLAAQARRLFAWGLNFDIFVADREWGERRGKCAACEELAGEQCKICKCFVDAKAYLAMERCPKGKWNRIWRRKSDVKKGEKAH